MNLEQIARKYQINPNTLNAKDDGFRVAIKSIQELVSEMERKNIDIQVISKVKGYKAPIGIVGPVINRKTSVPNPNEKRHNGWYAHIIYGSSRAFGEKVTYKALRQSTGIVFTMISKGVDRYLSRIKPTLKKVA